MNEADKTTIRKNTVALVEGMELPVVLDYLFARKTITSAQYEELMPNSNDQRIKKKREFLGAICRRGPNAFNEFCDALLNSDQVHLAKLLSPEKALAHEQAKSDSEKARARAQAKSDPEKAPARAQAKSDPEQHNVSTAETKPNTEQFISTPVKEVPQDKLSLYRQLVRDNKAYKMTYKRGRVLVINNEDFTQANERGKTLQNRDGTMNDAMNLNSLFNRLDFEHREKQDLTAEEMRKAIESETECEEHRTFGMFVLVILSHGAHGAVYGVDGELLQISTIKKLLGSQGFPHMKDKPKLILLQACQGEQRDGQAVGDGPETDAVLSAETAPRAELADMLIAYSTASGSVSYRDLNLGTWFIRAVVEVFRRDAWEDHVLDMLTVVRQQVLAMSGAHDLVQLTHDDAQLIKRVYLLPGWSGN